MRAFHASAPPNAPARWCASPPAGVPVRLADHDPALAELLGAELHGLVAAGPDGVDAAARESFSIRMRRAALRDHSLGARARQVCEAARIDPPARPLVSVLLATRRPGLLAHALANVARQRYPSLELVLALHGPGFEAGAVERAAAALAHPVKVLRLDGDRSLGSVLNAATAAAGGTLLAKMDDDDVYGPEHLWDLVLAREYSGAALVGKFPATVYLARTDRTVRCRPVRNETWARSISGGTMLIARADLERAGGWRRVRRHVDQALDRRRASHAGGGVYRTHDEGHVLVRHGDRHTWEAEDELFPRRCEERCIRVGIRRSPGCRAWLGRSRAGRVPPPLIAAGPSAPASRPGLPCVRNAIAVASGTRAPGSRPAISRAPAIPLRTVDRRRGSAAVTRRLQGASALHEVHAE